MKIGAFTVAGFILAIIFWLFESLVHYLIFEESQFEFIPGELNELWMRLIIVLLIFFYGLFVDFFIDRIVHKQLEVARTYNEMIFASRHILKNLVNQMHLFKVEAIKSKDFDRNIIEYYDNSINEAANLIDTLSRIEEVANEKR